MQGVRTQSLTGELRPHMLCGTAKKKKKQNLSRGKEGSMLQVSFLLIVVLTGFIGSGVKTGLQTVCPLKGKSL